MRSIRRQLTVRLVSGCALLWAVCGLGVYVAVRTSLIAEFDRALLAKAQGLASLVESHGRNEINMDMNREMMPEFAPGKGADYFEVWDGSGKLLRRSDSLRGADLPRGINFGMKTEEWVFSGFGHDQLRTIRVDFVPRRDWDDEDEGGRARHDDTPPVRLVVASDPAGIWHFLNILGAILLGSEVLVLAGTAGLASWIVRRGLSPLVLLAERARAINIEAPGMRFPTEGMPGELVPICVRLNDSLGRLEESFERERQFSSDVAHELRTPIAELRSLVEVAMRWPDEAGAGVAFETALQIALQMEGVVTQLLALLRCESGTQAIRRAPVDVCEIVRRSWGPFEVAANGKGLSSTFDLPAGFQIESDSTLLGGIFTNLLSNAVAYTPVDGRIEVKLTGSAGDFQITVANTADGIAAQDVPNFFKRYWRKDKARSAAEHNGLGLPLARAFAKALGLQLDAGLPGDDMLQMVLSARR